MRKIAPSDVLYFAVCFITAEIGGKFTTNLKWWKTWSVTRAALFPAFLLSRVLSVAEHPEEEMLDLSQGLKRVQLGRV